MPLLSRAFYPCCGDDFELPSDLLKDLVEEIVFCDIRRGFAETPIPRREGWPRALLLEGDVRHLIAELPVFDVFFYVGDSEGEGGSGVPLLGDQWFWPLLERLNPVGGLVVTDGHYSRGPILPRMKRGERYKYADKGWCIYGTDEFPHLSSSFVVARVVPIPVQD